MYYVGIDWGMQEHHICLLAEDGEALSQFSITDDLKGFERLKATLSPFREVQVNIERQDGLLVNWLVAQGYELRCTPPMIVASRRPRRTKHDRGDAYLLAYLLRLNDPDCRPLPQQSEAVLYLRQLVSARDDILKTQRQLCNRLIHVLRRYFPAMLAVFPTHHSIIMQEFLMAFSTPQQAKALSLAELERFLREKHYSQRTKRLQKIYRLLQEPVPYTPYDAGYQQHILYLTPILKALEEQRNLLEKQLIQAFKAHPESAWWSALPGASGALTSAYLLALIGDDRQRFPRPEVLQAMAGTCPISRRSGKQHQVEFRQACSHPLRQAMVQMARFSIQQSGWAKSYFQRQLERGHSVSRSYRALANRWAKILWKLWQTRQPYDEAIHLAHCARKGLAVPAA